MEHFLQALANILFPRTIRQQHLSHNQTSIISQSAVASLLQQMLNLSYAYIVQRNNDCTFIPLHTHAYT